MASPTKADSIFDILVRMSYETGEDEIISTNSEITRQSNLIKELQNRIATLESTRTAGQANYNRSLEQSTAVLQRVTNWGKWV